jgi:hypothetical protein
MLKAIVKFVVERLSERTTWVGILAALGVAVSATVAQLQAIGDLGVALAAAILVFGKDSFLAPDKPEDPPVA